MKIFLLVLCVACLLCGHAIAAAPNLISYQGRLTEGTGNPLTGVYSIKFTIYTSSAGAAYVWSEIQPSVSVSNGLFNVLLGSVTPVPDTVFQGTSRYLGVKIGNDPEILPRTQLVSVPWSNRVASVDGATGGNITTKVSIGTGHTNTGDDAFVAGLSNIASGPQSSIGGGTQNEVSGASSVVAGGQSNYAPGSIATIAGGIDNQTDGRSSAIGGGDSNRVYYAGYAATISGGRLNVASDTGAVVGGGSNNQATGDHSVVAGGGSRTAIAGNIASGGWSTVSGGVLNSSDSSYSNVTGGRENKAGNTYSIVAGGSLDTASGRASAVLGGLHNKASGEGSAVVGGYFNTAAGDFSLAAGRGAQALHPGCFVWHDTTSSSGYPSVDANQFMVYASGGIFMSGSGIKSQFGAGPNLAATKGGYYTDNSIVAWGKVSGASGAISTNEFGVSSVVRNSAGNYTIAVDIAATASANLIPTANAEVDAAPNSAATMRFVTINQVSTNSFDVYITNGSFTPTDNDFVFMVTAR